MSEIGIVVLAVAVWLGALVAAPVPLVPAAGVVLLSLALRRPAGLVMGAALLACALGASAWAGLEAPASRAVRGAVVLVSDPVEVGHSLRVDARLGDRRVEAWARGPAAGALHDRLAGEVVSIEGRLRAPPANARGRLAVRHIASRLDIARVGGWHRGSFASTAANGLRLVLQRGASSMRPDRRALLSGFLLGDTRDLPPPVEADFRASGLTHLLAVSGQNVAFVLAVAGPVLRRLRLRGRLGGSLAVIAFFAVVTRAEPSVLRASAMAALACWSAFAGRPVSRLRVLSLAVTALVLIDPMLPRSVGFQLSVGASIGLALLAAPIAARLGGPRWLADPLAVTIAAQIGVAPVLITTFGGLPLVTLAANLVAVPVAGPLTAWGLTAGFVAGLAGGRVAVVLDLPTGLMVGWIEGVARIAARVPLGLIDGHALLAAASVAAGAAAVSWVAPRVRGIVVWAPLLALVIAARPAAGAVSDRELAHGAHLWRAGATVLVLDAGADSARLLDGLRRAGVRRIDLVVARSGSRDVASVLVDLRARVPTRAIAAPPGARIRDATVVSRPVTVRIGQLTVRLAPRGQVLEVAV
ncbi:MAG: competence protein ComEC, partial [Actinomycetota bacterium]|nr:competence protein ComEC [Actinomycetota bacterium]